MSKPATLIYTHGGGRLGNQIIRMAHWLAWTGAHPGAVNVIDLGFWRYARFFRYWCEHPGCAFPEPSAMANLAADVQGLVPERFVGRVEWRFQRRVHAAVRYWPGGDVVALDDARGEGIDLDGPDFLREVARHRVTACGGWKIAGWRRFAEQQADLREFFRPLPRWTKTAAEFIAGLRAGHDLLVGVQIRQSDYRTWNQGRYFFPTTQYVAWLRQLLDLHPGRRVAFVIASEEWQDPALFTGLPAYFATGSMNAGGPWFESWVELAQCDLVLSPPSTFSATAAWFGRVPLWPVWASGQLLAPDQLLRDALLDAARHEGFSQCVK